MVITLCHWIPRKNTRKVKEKLYYADSFFLFYICNMKGIKNLVWLSALMLAMAVSCKKAGEYIPQAPDYSNDLMWYTADGDSLGTGADVFYVVSTWEVDWMTPDSVVSHYADVWNPVHREHMATEISGVSAYMSPGNRFYAPYYRHATIDAFVTQDEEIIHERTRLAMADVCEAFDHFLAERDPGRPLVIAGFSQGGMAMVELLKHMDDETYSHLAAAYVLGYKVTNEDMAESSHIRPAQGEEDTGVTICYNTVKDVQYVKPIISASDICINPVNWCTDATPVVLHDSITVAVSPEYHVLVVSGYSGSEYRPYKDLINVGDIHGCEPWLYSECLQENIGKRVQSWRNRKMTVKDVLEEIKGRDVVLFVADKDEISQADVPFPVVYTGMGKMRMFSGLVKWYETRADGGKPVVLNIGSAGSAKYPIGTIVNCTHFVNGGCELVDDHIYLPGEGASVFSGDYFMSTQTFSPEQVKALSQQYDLFDMEAYAVALFCKMHDIPFYCLKAVSDNLDGNLKDWRAILGDIRTQFTELLNSI